MRDGREEGTHRRERDRESQGEMDKYSGMCGGEM